MRYRNNRNRPSRRIARRRRAIGRPVRRRRFARPGQRSQSDDKQLVMFLRNLGPSGEQALDYLEDGDYVGVSSEMEDLAEECTYYADALQDYYRPQHLITDR